LVKVRKFMKRVEDVDEEMEGGKKEKGSSK